ncbi:hypothetical protein ACFQ3R_12560 [Mesonia ostreae]|uniref:Outer membrane protein beta-barrel domain-containing protein n=1 Tax=Mesonia ostreae TaxID=861110 RepID=A0ABU2KFD1_9FLAO|nr:hypothetical protein [Mesonia ostreae]MDT0293417.1 hypothetical protein [Mesonia ostreae]
MKKIVLLLVLFSTNLSQAQFIKEKSINAMIGYGLSSPHESEGDISNQGVFLQAEYVMKAASWIDFRPYLGFIYTSSNGKDIDENPTYEKAETTAVLLGGKARILAPIPYVAPYIELGIGASIGKFVTYTAFTDIDKTGVFFHVPFSFGLALGRTHNVDLGFTYYFQPSVEQTSGAVAVGLSFPLKS